MIRLKIPKAGLATTAMIAQLVKAINNEFTKNKIKKVTGGLTATQEFDGVVLTMDSVAAPTVLSTIQGGTDSEGNGTGGGGDLPSGGGSVIEGTPTWYPVLYPNTPTDVIIYTSTGRVNSYTIKPANITLTPGDYDLKLSVSLDADACIDYATTPPTMSYIPSGTNVYVPPGPSVTVNLIVASITISPILELSVNAHTDSLNILSLGTDLHLTNQGSA